MSPIRSTQLHVAWCEALSRWGRWWGDTAPSKSWLCPPNLACLQIVARPPNLDVLLTHCGQLILGKVSKFDATRRQILRPKRTKFDLCRFLNLFFKTAISILLSSNSDSFRVLFDKIAPVYFI